MRRLLLIEYIKVFSSPTVKALLAIHALLFLLIVIVGSRITVSIQGIRINELFEFPMVWQTFAWIASWFNFLLGILAIVIVTADHQLRIFRKQLVDGLSRFHLVLSKAIVLLTFSAYTTLLVFLAGLIFGLTNTTGVGLDDCLKGLQFLPVLFIQSFSYMALALLFAFLLKNAALAIVGYVLYFFPVEPIIAAMLPLHIEGYLPFTLISGLTPPPDFLSLAVIDGVKLAYAGAVEPILSIHGIVTASIYSAAFFLIVLFIAAKRNF